MKPHPIPDEQLVAFAADELVGEEAATIRAHVATCARCTRMVARYQRVRFILRDADFHVPPAFVVAKAHAIFPRPKPKPTGFLFFLRTHPIPAFASAAFAMLVLACGILFSISQLDLSEENAFYPVKNVVAEMGSAVSQTWQSLGGLRSPSTVPAPSTATPTSTSRPALSATPVSPTATWVVPLNGSPPPPPPNSDPNLTPAQRPPTTPLPVAVPTPPSQGNGVPPLGPPGNPNLTPGPTGHREPTATPGVAERVTPTKTPPKVDLMPNITPGVRETRPNLPKEQSENPNNNAQKNQKDPSKDIATPPGNSNKK